MKPIIGRMVHVRGRRNEPLSREAPEQNLGPERILPGFILAAAVTSPELPESSERRYTLTVRVLCPGGRDQEPTGLVYEKDWFWPPQE